MAKENNKEKAEQKFITCVYLAITECHFNIDGKEYSLYNNETYSLPDCPFVQSLIGQGRLVKQ
jgi:hypothetical protein